MRTTINIKDGVFEELLSLVKARTKTEAVNRALSDYVRIKRLEKLRSLRGKLKINLDVDRLRSLERHE